jgi:putative transposase
MISLQNKHQGAFMQIIGVHKNIYKLASYTLQQETVSKEQEIRYKQLGDWELLKKRKVPDAEIAKVTRISRATFYRRKSALNRHGAIGFEKRSKRPKNYRKSKISKEIHELILDIRLENPTYGKAKITAIIRRDNGVQISESSVGRILSKLMKENKINRYSAAKNTRKKRSFNSHAQKWHYGMKAKNPGEMLQIDHLTATKNGIKIKHFQAYDPVTKFVHAEIFSEATSENAAKFLYQLHNSLPFSIKSIQVDGGSEFMKDFENLCKISKIELFVIPPSRPQYNGGVERSNRTFREDFYNQLDYIDSIGDVKYKLKQALNKYNDYRPHQKLDNLTPNEYIKKYHGALSQML